jgi:hypothetical protein
MLHEISYHDLEFERVPVEFHSMRGVAQTHLARVGMPLIPQNVVNGVFYLYRSKADAEDSKNPGGTGFVVHYNATRHMLSPHVFYGITNWHVACKRGFSTIRLNTRDGKTDIIELGPEDWHFSPGKHDVAIVPLSLDDDLHDVTSVSASLFAEKLGTPYTPSIGVGDDVFMIGLFIDHEGATTNVPSARFGHISMLPNKKATIKQSTGFKGESFVVDMHSRTGFSGSPVYVYRTFGSDLTEHGGHRFSDLQLDNESNLLDRLQGNRSVSISGKLRTRTLFKLLGIHWGQFPEKWELHDAEKIEEAKCSDLIVEGSYVEGMSGMTCVIPAWDIMEVLDMPELKSPRDAYFAKAQAKISKSSAPKPESAASDADLPASDENPNHRADFTHLVDAAARKPPQAN